MTKKRAHHSAKIEGEDDGYYIDGRDLERTLVKNLIELQKLHTNLGEKFDKLAKEISNLLVLFESAARSFAEHPAVRAVERDKDFLDKIDRLLDQNKTIAKGLTMMEDHLRERVYGSAPNTVPIPENQFQQEKPPRVDNQFSQSPQRIDNQFSQSPQILQNTMPVPQGIPKTPVPSYMQKPVQEVQEIQEIDQEEPTFKPGLPQGSRPLPKF